MTKRPTPRLSQSAAWSRQPKVRSPAGKGVSAVLVLAVGMEVGVIANCVLKNWVRLVRRDRDSKERFQKKPALKRAFGEIVSACQSKTGDSTPSTLCSFGLVVVYCRWIFLSGKIMGAAPNAARAHS